MDKDKIRLNGTENEDKMPLNAGENEDKMHLCSSEHKYIIQLNSSENEDIFQLNSSENKDTLQLNSGENEINLISDGEEPKTIHSDPIPPEGGWGWFIVFGSFIIHVLLPYMAALFGLLYLHLVKELKLSTTAISWIYNLQAFIWNITGVIVGPLCSEFGWRKVALLGSILCFISVITTGYATAVTYIFFSFAVLNGVGAGLAFSVCHLAIPHYFHKRRGFAIAIAVIGISVGQFSLPLLIRYLQEKFGFEGAVLIFGGVMLHSIVASALFHPIEWHSKKNKSLNNSPINSIDHNCHHKTKKYLQESSICFIIKKIGLNIAQLSIQNIKLLKVTKVLIVAISTASFMSGSLNFFLTLPFSTVAKGFTIQYAAYCLSVGGIGSLLGRILIPVLSDMIKRKYMVCIFQIMAEMLIAIAILSFTFLEDFIWIVVCLGIVGFGNGIATGLYTLVVIEIVGLKNLPSTYGATSFVVALMFITTGPIAGWLRDTTNSYNISNLFLSLVVFFGCSLWILMPFAIRKQQTHQSL